MVDVVFVLLLFFMARSGMRQIETRMKLEIPQSGATQIDPPIVIDISSEGAVRCNGLELAGVGENDLTKLRGWLQKVATMAPDSAITIRPEANAEHARFIDVLATLQSAGLKRISFS